VRAVCTALRGDGKDRLSAAEPPDGMAAPAGLGDRLESEVVRVAVGDLAARWLAEGLFFKKVEALPTLLRRSRRC